MRALAVVLALLAGAAQAAPEAGAPPFAVVGGGGPVLRLPDGTPVALPSQGPVPSTAATEPPERTAPAVSVRPAEAGQPRPQPRAVPVEAAGPRPRARPPEPATAPPEAPLAAQAAALAASAARPVPRARPDAAAPAPSAAAVPAEGQGPRPRARPPGETRATVPVAAAAIVPPTSLAAVARSLRPAARPAALAQRRAPPPAAPSAPAPVQAAAIVRPAPGGDVVLPRRGAVCGNPEIRGETLAPITGSIRGCGIASPVRVTSVAGVALSTPALMDCPTAQALHTWVERGAKPAIGRTGGGLVRLEVAAHYVCRTRNHRRGAPLSEHAKGRAIDIKGFTLQNGQTLHVLGGWRGPHRDILRAAYRAACGPFGTTLGPGSDGMHEDHYHFDTARHRSGSYCR